MSTFPSTFNNPLTITNHQNIVEGEKGERLGEGGKSRSDQQGALAPFKPGEVVDEGHLSIWIVDL